MIPLMIETSKRLGDDFFTSYSCHDLAKKLLGKILCRKSPRSGKVLAGIIVETECYPGQDDPASHSFGGKRTPRNLPMYMKPGTAYVYFTYGMYHCFNISSVGEGAAVLIRSLEPVSGLEEQAKNRLNFKKDKPSSAGKIDAKQLANGPGKLCIALDIVKDSINKEYLTTSQHIWLVDHTDYGDEEIVVSKRIGINTDPVSKNQLWRYYVKGNPYVSIKEKIPKTSRKKRKLDS